MFLKLHHIIQRYFNFRGKLLNRKIERVENVQLTNSLRTLISLRSCPFIPSAGPSIQHGPNRSRLTGVSHGATRKSAPQIPPPMQ